MKVLEQVVRPISFNNDVFFRHSFSGSDEKAKELRASVIEELLHRQFDELVIITPEITPDRYGGKDIRLDILLKERETGKIVNIEMQVSKYNVNQAKRFQYYSSRLITDQPIAGIKYSELVTTYQIIFIDDVPVGTHQLVNSYSLKDEEGKEMLANLTNQVYVYLPVINEIIKDKEIEELSDFEKLCYLFKNNIDDAIIKATKETEGMAKILMEKYEEFAKEKELYSWARAVEDGRLDVEARIADGHEEGLEEGVRQGIKQGLIQGLEHGLEQGQIVMAKKAIEQRYRQDVSAWLEGLTVLQLESIMKFIFAIDDFTTFKQEVEKIK